MFKLFAYKTAEVFLMDIFRENSFGDLLYYVKVNKEI